MRRLRRRWPCICLRRHLPELGLQLVVRVVEIDGAGRPDDGERGRPRGGGGAAVHALLRLEMDVELDDLLEARASALARVVAQQASAERGPVRGGPRERRGREELVDKKFHGNREQKTGAIYSRLLVRVSSPLHSVAMDLWTGLGQAATVAQLVGADVGGLISMIVQAAITARQNKSECEQLAHRVHAAWWPRTRRLVA
ncbi:hypothetical protein ZWY2020_049002 [Hordeum vulgare]|nr:hypothetical protein ZWY2020_049002 [Hordeum vulgare]